MALLKRCSNLKFAHHNFLIVFQVIAAEGLLKKLSVKSHILSLNVKVCESLLV